MSQSTPLPLLALIKLSLLISCAPQTASQVQFDREDEPLSDFLIPGGFLLMNFGRDGCEWSAGNAFIDDLTQNFGKSQTYCHAAFVLGDAKDYKEYEKKKEAEGGDIRDDEPQEEAEIAVLHAASLKEGTIVSTFSRGYFNRAARQAKLVSMQVKGRAFSKEEIKKVVETFLGRP